VRAVCLLAIALVCAVAVAQAVHAHPENTTTSHHACSICATAHAGLSVETAFVAPILFTAALAAPVRESSGIFRPAAAHFIRPPPAA